MSTDTPRPERKEWISDREYVIHEDTPRPERVPLTDEERGEIAYLIERDCDHRDHDDDPACAYCQGVTKAVCNTVAVALARIARGETR